MQRFFFFSFLFLIFSCGEVPTTEQETEATIELPNTPETVVRQWQNWVDNNDFEKAAMLSTSRAKEWLNMLHQYILAENDTTKFTTEFKELNCNEEKQTAKCGYIILEEGETFQDTFFLFKENGQWLVDIQDEMTEQDILEMERLMDSLLQVQ